MAESKRMVCLANSRKLSGRCIAGREIRSGGYGSWIRPVSARPLEEVSEHERQYKDGSDPRVLDVIDVPVLEHCPRTYQSENWRLDPDFYWSRVTKLSWLDLRKAAESPPTLWLNGQSTRVGRNDRVLLAEAERLDRSLYFVALPSTRLHVFAPSADFGNMKRRVQAAFEYNGELYKMWVTDPDIERKYLAMEDGHYDLPESYATISLGEPNSDGYCYKLVAALITGSGAEDENS